MKPRRCKNCESGNNESSIKMLQIHFCQNLSFSKSSRQTYARVRCLRVSWQNYVASILIIAVLLFYICCVHDSAKPLVWRLPFGMIERTRLPRVDWKPKPETSYHEGETCWWLIALWDSKAVFLGHAAESRTKWLRSSMRWLFACKQVERRVSVVVAHTRGSQRRCLCWTSTSTITGCWAWGLLELVHLLRPDFPSWYTPWSAHKLSGHRRGRAKDPANQSLLCMSTPFQN